MYVYGASQIHQAQSIRPPHRTGAAAATGNTNFDGVDELDISHEADFVSQARDLPEIREDRVAQIRAQIAKGTYDTDAKLNIALDRLLDEIG